MPETIIKVENLSKLYRIGAKEGYKTFRETLIDSAKAPFMLSKNIARRVLRPLPSAAVREREFQENTIWALKDISFDVKRGEVVGIIGRNGAGKSTLLKVLSKITEPTEGRVELRGRVGSLLEVGTGFHPELTGHENVYLYGAILGMDRWEVTRKFDEIIAFAELEKFVDTPVKRYSSGMYMRLAFAVAAHLEPEILLVEVVLAVGDVQFQKKCLGKMGAVSREGRTVLFVSHNMAAINRLCAKAILLNEGELEMMGSAEEVVAAYLYAGPEERAEYRWDDPETAPRDEHIRLRAIRILNSDAEMSYSLDIRKPFYVEIEYEILRALSSVRTGFRIITAEGTVVFTTSDTNDTLWEGRTRYPGAYVSRCEIPGNLLNEGKYAILNVWADIPFVKVMFIVENPLTFNIEQTGGVAGRFPERWTGVVCPALKWTITMLDSKGS
jgi:lipopolysaccharide transport system ATP-binding protein